MFSAGQISYSNNNIKKKNKINLIKKKSDDQKLCLDYYALVYENYKFEYVRSKDKSRC